MLANFTDIILLLDRSSSMLRIAESTRASLNQFIDDQRQVRGAARVTLVQFSGPGDFKYTNQNTPLEAFPVLDVTNYRPNGSSTALYDAMARLIDELGARYRQEAEEARPNRVVFVVLTDGLDNQSRYHTPESVKQRVETQRGYQWQFVFLGANQDAVLTAQELGMPSAMAITYQHSDLGVRCATASISREIGTYRSMQTYDMNVTKNDRDEAAKGGK